MLQNLRVVDVKKAPIPPEGFRQYIPASQEAARSSRFYDVIFDKVPHLEQRPGMNIDGETSEPVVDFPLKVSKSDIEHFTFRIAQGPDCMCSWRLALDWTSGRSVEQSSTADSAACVTG